MDWEKGKRTGELQGFKTKTALQSHRDISGEFIISQTFYSAVLKQNYTILNPGTSNGVMLFGIAP